MIPSIFAPPKTLWGNMGGAVESYPGVRCGHTLIGSPSHLHPNSGLRSIVLEPRTVQGEL